MPDKFSREIPFNYTSADDQQIVISLLGKQCWSQLESLRAQRVTGRSAKLLLRVIGDIFIYQRNAYLYEELINTASRRLDFLRNIETDLVLIEKNSFKNEVVHSVIKQCRVCLKDFLSEVKQVKVQRKRLQKALQSIIGSQNIKYDPLTLVSHATDATDWRLHLPFAVVYPSCEEQVGPLVRAIANNGWSLIPRGAGTGLTGGAVPLVKQCIVINTEKLNKISAITTQSYLLEDETPAVCQMLTVEAGVVTEDAMEAAHKHKLVFATDPTSGWASTIGGNISENAGGKSAVLWGTAIDNLISFRFVNPQGEVLTINRLHHPQRKIYHEDILVFEILNSTQQVIKTVILKGSEIRKNGLWKDITNKVLGGVPGLQKEGTDGVITSADFILYPAFECKRTLCLEFFGENMNEASQVIVAITSSFEQKDREVLLALEHFDDQYISVINYRIKARRTDSPRAVLLIDVGGHSAEQVQVGLDKIAKIIETHPNTEIFIAENKAESERFWQDRKKLGAISARTNAFKLNEDIVLPINQLAPFASFIDEINAREELQNQTQCVEAWRQFLTKFEFEDDPTWYQEKLNEANQFCTKTVQNLTKADTPTLRSLVLVLDLQKTLLTLFQGNEQVIAKIQTVYQAQRHVRLVVATHMHAGDGNVHVNIPIHSNNRAMMVQAEQIVDAVMAKVQELGGVISGEHGIGLTKLKYLDEKIINELKAYRLEIDPLGLVNRGKLADRALLDLIFTPSFNLLELEAQILKRGSLEVLATKISQCVRCGKCKPTCCVFAPQQDLFYDPRSKNLGIGAIIEALLYDSQRYQTTGFDLLKRLENIADHCTLCHKCLKPCPVDIDTGEVSVLERELIKSRHFKHTTFMTLLSLGFLRSRSVIYNSIFRFGILIVGSSVQKLVSSLSQPIQLLPILKKWYLVRILKTPLTPASPKSLYNVLPLSKPNQATVLSPAQEATKSVFYFPGCGSERLYGDISLAVIYLLLKQNVQVILPPAYLCCGFPFYANARYKEESQLTLRNNIIFEQMRQMFSYLTFDACVISCGTCREALEKNSLSDIFEAPVLDIAEFLNLLGFKLKASSSEQVLYHTPCHDSLKGKAVKLISTIGSYEVTPTPYCCSESGTLSFSRPDISEAMRQRKEVGINEVQNQSVSPIKLLTNCPSCLQGLGRQTKTKTKPVHIAVELATQLGGLNWQKELKSLITKPEQITF